MKKIYSIPFDSDFLTRLGEFILGDCRQPSNVAIVFAGKRPSLYLKKILSEAMETPAYPPTFFSIEEFIDYIARKDYPFFKDLESPDALWLLYRSIRSMPVSARGPFRQKSFGEFFYWGTYLLDFIDRLDMENIQNDRLKILEENAQIGYDVPANIKELLRCVSVLRNAFHTLLDRDELFTRGYKYLAASRLIESLSVDEFEKIYFAGLYCAPGFEKVIIKHLWDKGKAEIIVEGDPSDWPVLKGFVADLGASVEPIVSGYQTRPTIKIYSGFDTHSEVLKAYSILKENKRHKTAVILPLSDALFPFLTFVADRIASPYNVAIGYPLERTPVFNLIIQIINAQILRQGENTYPIATYLNLLFHPFIKNIETEKGIGRTILNIAKLFVGDNTRSALAFRPFITLEEVERAIRSSAFGEELGEKSYDSEIHAILHEIHENFFTRFEQADTLYDYAENLAIALEFLLDHTYIRSYIFSGDIFRVVLKSLEKIKIFAFSKTIFHEDKDENRQFLCDFIIRLLKPVDLLFETRPVESLEIIGLLESRNITFDTVIILDVNESILPQQKEVNPLIPIGVHEMLGIPTQRQREEVSRYYFERLIASSKNAHIIYIDGKDTPRSRYIEKIVWETEKSAKTLDIVQIDKSVLPINLKPRKVIPRIMKTPPVMGQLCSKTYSPSSIDNYLFCPVFFYYRDILNFEEKKVLIDDIDPTERGIVIHNILRDTFEGYLNREFTLSMHREIIGRLDKVIDSHIKGMTGSGDYYLFKRLTAFKLDAFLRRDFQTTSDTFLVQYLEKRFTHPIAVGDRTVNLTGKIDRIDHFPGSNSFVVIDYKTGALAPYRKKISPDISLDSIADIHTCISSFQLPVYIYLFHREKDIPVGSVNAKLIFLKNNTEELFFKGSAIEEKEYIYETYMKGLRTTLQDILDPERPFTPFDDKTCVECVFSHLCHV